MRGLWAVLGSCPLDLRVLVAIRPPRGCRVGEGGLMVRGRDGLVAGGGDQAPLAADGPVSPQGGARAPAGAAHTAPHHVPVGEGCHPGEGQPGTAGAAGQAAGRKAMAQPEGAAAAGPGPTAPGPPGPTACGELPPPALPAPLQLLTSPAAALPPRHLPAGLGLPSTPAPVPPLRLPSPLTVSRPTLALPHTAQAGRAVLSSAPCPSVHQRLGRAAVPPVKSPLFQNSWRSLFFCVLKSL